MNEGRSTTSNPVRAGAVAVGLTVAALVASIAVGVAVLLPAFLLGYAIDSLPVLVAGLIAGQLGFLAVGLLYTWRYGVRIPISWPTRRSIGYVVGGTAFGLVIAFGGLALLDILGVAPESALEETAAIDPTFLLIIAALSVVLVAPAEEYLFRGVIQGRLRESLGPVPAILGASLLFGAMHFMNYIGSPVEILGGVLLITSVGAVFGALYELTDNLTVPILVHAVYNVILSLLSYFAM